MQKITPYIKDIIKQKNRYTTVELLLTNKCHKNCTYCYRKDFNNDGDIEMFPLERIKTYIDNAFDMGLIAKQCINIELFGGEPIINLDYFKSVLKLLNSYNQFSSIVIPTNGYVLENILDPEIDELLDIQPNLHFSLSIDTEHQENINRPISPFGIMCGFTAKRNWNRLAHIAHKYKAGVHPMLYFPTASKWFDVWKFFIDQNINPYLLEVRHGYEEDTNLIEGVYQLAKIKLYALKNNISGKFNTTETYMNPRGLTCGALTTLNITFDGYGYFCHRVLWEKYKFVDYTTKSIDLTKYLLYSPAFDMRNGLVCSNCPIRPICSSVCVGMVEEYWGKYGCTSLPITSQCKYYLLKYGLFFKLFEDWKKLTEVCDVDYLDKVNIHNFGENIYDTIIGRLQTDGLL